MGSTDLYFTLHNILPTLLSVSTILQYGFILHIINEKVLLFNMNLKKIIAHKTTSLKNTWRIKRMTKQKALYDLLSIHFVIYNIIDDTNDIFSTILHILLFYLLVAVLFRLYISIQIFWDVLMIQNHKPLYITLLGLVTLGRQLLVHPFIILIIMLSEYLRNQVSIQVRSDKLFTQYKNNFIK